jgi:uncharacterized protein YaiI (UPF0178 family)
MVRRRGFIERPEMEKKRFVSDFAYVLDTVTGERHFGRRVFDIDGAEYDEVNLSPADRIHIIADIGLEGCIAILQRAFDAQGKPYNAKAIIESLPEWNYSRNFKMVGSQKRPSGKLKGKSYREREEQQRRLLEKVFGPLPRKKSAKTADLGSPTVPSYKRKTGPKTSG